MKVININGIQTKERSTAHEQVLGALIWHCVCDSELFLLHENGDVECNGCNKISDAMVCGMRFEQ